MRIIELSEFEDRFYEILDDIEDKGAHYQINYTESDEACVLMPLRSYSIFDSIYEDWIENR